MAIRSLSSSLALRNLAKPLEVNFARSMSSKSSDSKNVGFIGIGNMGSNMSGHLLKAGHKMHVYDLNKKACDKIKDQGAKVYDDPADVAAESDFVVTMLPNSAIVYDTYARICQKYKNPNTFFIDSSTIAPSTVKDVQQFLCEKGSSFIDAPVSGGVVGAQNATLTFMVGGTKEEFETVKPILSVMGKRIVHCGSYGMGQCAKLCNNMMLGISMCGVAETMNLAIRLGLDKKLFAEILNSSTGRCWASEINNPVPGIVDSSYANKNYEGGFSADLITKDLGLASEVATESNSPIPMGGLAHAIYRTLKAQGRGNKDFAVIYDFMKNDKN